MKKGLSKHIIKQIYFNDPKVMVNFIKGDENIFRAESMTPHNYWTGIGISLLWAIGLLIAATLAFQRTMFPKSKLPENAYENVELFVRSGKKTSIDMDVDFYETFSHQVLNVFYGKGKNFSGKITYDGKPFSNEGNQDFVYIPNHSHLPGDVKVKDLITLIAKLGDFPADQVLKGIDKNIRNAYLDKIDRVEATAILLKMALSIKTKTFILDEFLLNIYLRNGNELNPLFTQLEKKATIVHLRSKSPIFNDYHYTHLLVVEKSKLRKIGDKKFKDMYQSKNKKNDTKLAANTGDGSQ
ncbi:MAG: hypothetical protein GY757_13220 [bacterium]|nr:hypothetical protein [bacterium]